MQQTATAPHRPNVPWTVSASTGQGFRRFGEIGYQALTTTAEAGTVLQFNGNRLEELETRGARAGFMLREHVFETAGQAPFEELRWTFHSYRAASDAFSDLHAADSAGPFSLRIDPADGEDDSAMDGVTINAPTREDYR